MASLSELVTPGGLRPMGVAATVSRAPVGPDGTLDVFHVTDAGERADEQGLRWASRGGALPVVGDDALLFLDSLGDPWAVVWPAGATSDVSGSLSALHARRDVLEAVSTPLLLSGVLKVSAKRTLSAVTMAPGANLIAADLSGLTPVGIIVAHIVPALHNTFTWYPNVGGIVFTNSGVSQTVTVDYYAVGT